MFLTSVREALASVARWTLTGRKRKASDQEPSEELEPPVPESGSRPRLQAHPLAPQALPAGLRGPERLDFSSPALNGPPPARGGAAPAAGGGSLAAAAAPPAQRGQALAAARRLDPSLAGTAPLGGLLPGVQGPAPFTKSFAPPSHLARTPCNAFARDLRHVRNAPASLARVALTPDSQRRPAAPPPSLRGLFTGSKLPSAAGQQQRAAQRPRRRQQQQWQVPRQQSMSFEMQPLRPASRIGGGQVPSSSQMEDAVLLRRVVDMQLEQERRHEQQMEQQPPAAPSRVEEIDLTGEPSGSSQQPPPAQHPQQQQQRGQQQQQRQQQAATAPAPGTAPAAAAAAPPGSLAARVAAVSERQWEWRKMIQGVRLAEEDAELADLGADMAPPHVSAADQRYRQAVEEAILARRRALQATHAELQCVQQAHTTVEQQQPGMAQRADAEAQQIQQQLRELQLKKPALGPAGQQQQQQQAQQQQQQAQQKAAPPGRARAAAAEEAAPAAEEEGEEVVDLLSSSESEAEQERELSVSMAPAATQEIEEEEEEEEVSEQLQRVALAEAEERALVIPPEWEEEYESVLAPGPAGEVLADHQRSAIQITRKDMACMAPLQWLNDEVINLYISLLLERDAANRKLGKGPRCHFFSTFFANKLYKDGGYDYGQVRKWTLPKRLRSSGQASESILDCDRIILPVHQGLHWVCAMIDLQNRKFVYYDSLRNYPGQGEDPHCLDCLARYLRDEYANKRQEQRDDVLDWPREFPKAIPRQQNGCDCGVFTLLFASHAGLGAPMAFSQADIDAWRVRIVHELLALRLE